MSAFGLEKLEINAPKKYYTFKETPEYRVFSDKNNPDAFDANFAVLKKSENARESIKQVEIFHEAAGAVPLFVSAPDSITEQEAKALLQPEGYSFCNETLTVMQALLRASYKDIMPISCDVRMHTELSGAEREFFITLHDGQEYGALMLDRKLKADAKYFTAYNSEKEPVSNCVCESYGEVLYIGNVFTRENSRRRGFARAALCAALTYAYDKSYAAVYLHVSKNETRNLYEKLGFKEITEVNKWKAFKGELPDWIIKNAVKVNE